jgi:hypothetical protein
MQAGRNVLDACIIVAYYYKAGVYTMMQKPAHKAQLSQKSRMYILQMDIILLACVYSAVHFEHK